MAFSLYELKRLPRCALVTFLLGTAPIAYHH